jgi:AraC family transcriptional regulator
LARLVAELSHMRSALTRHAEQNAALCLSVQQLCQTVREAVVQNRRRVSELARGDSRGMRPVYASRRRTGGLTPARLHRVIDHIETSLSERLDVASLAAVAGMSRGHFAAMFKQTTGLSPHQAVMRHRLERSKILLADETLSIAEIGCQLGFSSQAHFSTLFRRQAGLSPQVWRRRHHTRASQNQSRHSINSENTKKRSEDSESQDRLGRALMGAVTEPPYHADTGASRPGTA